MRRARVVSAPRISSGCGRKAVADEQGADRVGRTGLAQLLTHLGRDNVPCAVEVNQQLVPKAKHSQHQLHGGDRVELVTLVGGG